MKKFVIIIFLISLLALLAKLNNQDYLSSNSKPIYPKSSFIKGQSESTYNFKIYVDTDKNILQVNQQIIWKNNSRESQSRVYLYLPINSLESPKTEFAKNFSIENEHLTKIDFSKIFANGFSIVLKYITESRFTNFDRTLAYFDLKHPIFPDSTLKLEMEYKIKIPKSFKNFGYAPGRNFFMFDKFYPRIAVFENGKWILNQVHSFSSQAECNSNFLAEVNYPADYELFSNSVSKVIMKNKHHNTAQLNAEKIKDFSFCISNEHIKKKFVYHSISGNDIDINVAIRESRENYLSRIKTAVFNSIDFLEKNIDEFPFSKLQVIDVNQASNSANESIPGMIRISVDLFSLEDLREIEQDVTYLIAKQYFENSLLVNPNYDSWITEGISSYLSDKIYKKYYDDPYVYFDFISYYPVYGLNLLSYNEIPIIYSIGKIQYPVEYRNLNKYYENLSTLSITDSTFKISSENEYFIVNRLKAKLLLMMIERQITSDSVIKKGRNFYVQNKNQLIDSKNFIEFINLNFPMFNEIYLSQIRNEVTDNKILSIRKIDNDKYEVTLSKNSNSSIPIDIQINVGDKSFRSKWQDSNRIAKLIIRSKEEINSVIIDPEKKYIDDINFSNNSFILEKKYWGSLSLAIRAFFWFQNALLIMGSV